MKKLLLFSFVLMNWVFINAQIPIITQIFNDNNTLTLCSSQNNFLEESIPDGLSEVTDYIDLSSGIAILNSARWLEAGGEESVREMLALNTNYSFEQRLETTIRGKKYVQYQQFYKGIKVENGGFTVSYRITTDPDDCPKAYLLSLGIVDRLDDVKTNALISNSNATIRNILESHPVNAITYPHLEAVTNLEITDAIDAELLISNTGLANCQNRLVWKINYNQEGAKVSWIDARTGGVLMIADAFSRLTAPIETGAYADDDLSDFSDSENPIYRVDLDDSNVGGITSLISSDGRVLTYNFATEPSTIARFTADLIPTTTASEWTTEATTHVFQTHHIATQVLPVFDNIGINFGTVNIGAFSGSNAQAFWSSSTNTAFLFMGEFNGASTALYDVLAHELAHAHIYDFMPGGPAIAGRTMREAIADMIGTYVESILQGEVDWLIGDDEDDVSDGGNNRDLSNVHFTCFNSGVDALEDPYLRGEPLRHLFYLLSEGQNTGTYIPALGIENALRLILDGMYMLGPGVIDYDLLRTATLMQVRLNSDECSDEQLALERAWKAICVDGNDTPCYTLNGTRTVCQESDQLSICIDGGSFEENYRWNFPLEWTVVGNPVGNTVYGHCFTVLDFPDYSYYPRTFTLQVWSENSGSPQQVRVVLEDCNGDDPDCGKYLASLEEVQNLQTNGNLLNNSVAFGLEKSKKAKAKILRVFDSKGSLLFTGKIGEFNDNLLTFQTGLLIFSWFDEEGRLVATEKRLNLK